MILQQAARRLHGFGAGTGAMDGTLSRTFVAIYVPVALLLIVVGWHSYFGPAIYEVGDYAANGLQIDRAEHLAEILGNYSRFKFHHPGPAFFYVYAAGDVLFRQLLHVVQAPGNAELLSGALLQAGFLSLGLAILARLVPNGRATFILVSVGLAVAFFGLVDAPEFQIWPPYQIVLPFVCLLCAAIGMTAGMAAAMPAAALAGGFLVHGHVAQPLFVLPIFGMAYALLYMRQRRSFELSFPAFIRRTARAHALSFVIAAIFAVPLVLDALKGPQSNLAAILADIGQHNPTPSWGHALFYVLQLVALRGRAASGILDMAPPDRFSFLASAWPLLVGWPAAVALLAFALRRFSSDECPIAVVDGRALSGGRFGVGYLALVALGAVLMVVWAKEQQAELFAFNGFFFNGLLYVALLPAAFLAARAGLIARRSALVAVALGLALVFSFQGFPLAGVTTLVNAPGDTTGAQLTDSAARLAELTRTTHQAILLDFDPPTWPLAVGLALALERQGVLYLVRPNWGFMFGYDHVYPGSPLPAAWHSILDLTLARTGAAKPGQEKLADTLVATVSTIIPSPP